MVVAVLVCREFCGSISMLLSSLLAERSFLFEDEVNLEELVVVGGKADSANLPVAAVPSQTLDAKLYKGKGLSFSFEIS